MLMASDSLLSRLLQARKEALALSRMMEFDTYYYDKC